MNHVEKKLLPKYELISHNISYFTKKVFYNVDNNNTKKHLVSFNNKQKEKSADQIIISEHYSHYKK